MDKSTFGTRLQTLFASAERNEIDNVLITNTDGIRYLTGVQLSAGRRFLGLLLNASGNYLIIPQMDLERIHTDADLILLPYSDKDDFTNGIKDLLQGTVGIEKENISFMFAEKIAGAGRTDLRTLRDVSGLLSSMRMIKSKPEINALQTACDKTDKLLEKWVRHVIPGKSDIQLRRELDDLSLAEGITESCPGILIEGGVNSSAAHGLHHPNSLKKGDVIYIDCGARWDGYYCDITRTFFAGKPDCEMEKVYRIVLEAQTNAIEAIKPGAVPEEIDAAARNIIEEAGYGEYFTHGLGHGLGVSVHEEPYLRYGNRMPLRPGMVVTVEPGIYLPGKWGIRIEDDVLVTENGHHVFNHFPKEFEQAILDV